MTAPGALLLAWLPFVNPVKLPVASLWMFLPLAACVAVVYRTTRARTAEQLPKATVKTFANIVVGMVLIAAAAYALDVAVVHFSAG